MLLLSYHLRGPHIGLESLDKKWVDDGVTIVFILVGKYCIRPQKLHVDFGIQRFR